MSDPSKGTVLVLALALQLRSAATKGTDVTIPARDADALHRTLESLLHLEHVARALTEENDTLHTQLTELTEQRRTAERHHTKKPAAYERAMERSSAA